MGVVVVSARAVLLGVPGFSSLSVLRLWVPLSFGNLVHLRCVVGWTKRRVHVGGVIVAARAVLLGVSGFSSFSVLHLWASSSFA